MNSALKLIMLLISNCILIEVTAQVRDYWPTNGWQQKTPAEAEMNGIWIDLMQQKIDLSMSFVDAFLVAKDGYLVFEKYYNNYDEDKYHILCSSTKSITSIIIGMMLKQKILDSVGEKIMVYFPEYGSINSDTRLNELTIEHMLTFTAGLTNDDDNSIPQSDMISFYLSQPFFANPGTQFKYATPASQMLSAMVNKKTGDNAKTFALKNLFPKLGVNNYYWPCDAQDYTFGGHNSYFCPRDMLKFGFLYLNNGIWDGDTLVDPAFVATSTVAHTNGGNPHKEKYGYNWWITENNGYHAYFAGGYGGQFIYVVPGLDLVVAITCRTDKHREDARFLINDYVVPAILNLTATGKTVNKSEPRLNVFPNPACGEITVVIEQKETSPVSLFITDICGRTVISVYENRIMVPGNEFFVLPPALHPGCYIVKALVGEKELTERVIIIRAN